MLDVFDRQRHHVPPTEIVKTVCHAFKVNVKHVVVKIEIAIATNAVKVEFVSHCADVMTTADMVKFVKTSFVQPDAVQMHIALVI